MAPRRATPPLGGPLGVDLAAPWPRPWSLRKLPTLGRDARVADARAPSRPRHDDRRRGARRHPRASGSDRPGGGIFVYDKEGYASRIFSRACARAMVGNTPRLTGAARVVNFPDHGRLAQLAERWPHMPEVTGSSPVSSTTQPHVSATPDKPQRRFPTRCALRLCGGDRHCAWRAAKPLGGRPARPRCCSGRTRRGSDGRYAAVATRHSEISVGTTPTCGVPFACAYSAHLEVPTYWTHMPGVTGSSPVSSTINHHDVIARELE